MTEKLPTGTLCWSLTAGFPLWPAVVMSESDVPESVLSEPHTPTQTLVRFFGSVSYGWMDVCYPFRDNFEAYSKPEGAWAGFEEAIEEAQTFEKTGQFIMVPQVQAGADEDSGSDSDPAPRRRRTAVKRRRPARSSDDDENFGGSDDDGAPSKGRKAASRRTKRTSEAKAPKPSQRTIRASKEQKLFAREIFGMLKQIEKAIKEKNLDEALSALKKFDPKTTTKRLNKEGVAVDAPGPYAQIETQVVHISRLGKFVHGLAKHHEDDILGPYAQMLYRHLLSNAHRELALPEEIEAYISNTGATTTAPSTETATSSKVNQGSSMNASEAPSQTQDTTDGGSMQITDEKPNSSDKKSSEVVSGAVAEHMQVSDPATEPTVPINHQSTMDTASAATVGLESGMEISS